jgi:protein-S-isoprenylcysteine O-methyltransferase Ste14
MLFFLVGPGLEAGVGPWLLTGGFETGSAWEDLWPLRAAGAALIVAGLAVLVPAYAGIVRDGRGTPSPAAPTQRLVVTGPYRRVRNPMYVATAAVIAGEGLLLSQPILLLAAAVYLATLAALVRFVEEPRLRERFGPEYDSYRRDVRAWVPR